MRLNTCIFSQLFIVFPFLGHPVWLKHSLKRLSMYLDQKNPKRLQLRRKTITGEQLYWLRSNMCNFSQLFIVFPFFGHPVWLKTHRISLSLYSDQKAPKRLQLRRKTNTGEQLYWLRSNMCIFSQLFIVFPFFGHPVWLKHTLNMFIYVFRWKGTQKAPA